MHDYYQILGLAFTQRKYLGQADFKKAYKKSALKNHPDKGGTAEQFILLTSAFETLFDPISRKQYDEQFLQQAISAGMDVNHSKVATQPTQKKSKTKLSTANFCGAYKKAILINGRKIGAGYDSYIAIRNKKEFPKDRGHAKNYECLIQQIIAFPASIRVQAINSIKARFNDFDVKEDQRYFRDSFLPEIEKRLRRKTHYVRAKCIGSAAHIDRTNALLQFRRELELINDNQPDKAELFKKKVATYKTIIGNKRGFFSRVLNLETNSTQAVEKIASEFEPQNKRRKI